ncbi:MAG: ABC transporter substrate-binding protein [Deltaproteobacteria bacterium]|nr:MAG: ABC transporter substrate-binding protein [Deltaproteobacteria bacterium]
MKHVSRIAALFTLVTFLGLFCITSAFAADTIKIGEINTYSKLTNFTFPYRNGWQLALSEINAAGGVNGKMLEVISRDDAGKPGTAVTIAEELVTKDKVALLMGSFFSHIGLALTDFAKRNKVLYVAAEPLSDALVWAKGNRYTFRLRPSTYMQAAMLAAEAAKNPAKKWATIAPNYAYGKDAVKSFKKVLKSLRPDVEFVAEQWPALFKINAGSEIQALTAAKPDAVFNVTFGGDLAKFVREGKLRGFFKNTFVVSLLTGEPEYIDPLKGEAPEGWLVTGYPWYEIKTPAHDKFAAAYQKKYNDYPRTGSLVGYNVMMAVAAMLKKAGSTDTEKMVDAMEGLTFDSPVGPILFRKIDHQSTMGAYVGYTALKDGKGKMVDWAYKDGKDFLPGDAEVMQLRAK